MLLEFTDKGIYCPQADVYIDPWKAVDKAIITHAHSDHARWGMKHYLCHEKSKSIIQHRLGNNISIETKKYNETFSINGVKFSLHPAGHVIGSSQIRVEYNGEIWVVSGDYKTEFDGISDAFEPIKCHTFITECTFGLPIYKWQKQSDVFKEMINWIKQNESEGYNSIIFAYALGKAQRIIQNIFPEILEIYTHGAIENTNKVIRESGTAIAPTILINKETDFKKLKGKVIIAPPSAQDTPWMRKLEPCKTAVASGWMALRGARRRRNIDKGFILSDHADWIGLNNAIANSQCETVIATHGYTEIFSRWLNEKGYHALTEKTQFEGETGDISNEIE
ncbi:MAG: ligase-associated DNA damage response exonuclease [Bacteroidia bacterium]